MTVPMYIADEMLHKIGNKAQLQALFEVSDYGAVFEDDGETGYFYLVDTNWVLDALHIYDAMDIQEADIPFDIKILSDENLTIFALSINDTIHALFDRNVKFWKNRNAFPEVYWDFILDKNRQLTDEILESYFWKAEEEEE